MRGWKWGLAVATAAMMLGIIVGKGQAAPARRAPSPAEQYGMEEADRDDGLLQDVVLGMHNDERSRWGLSPLAWDRTLAADAARYARQMARTNIFAHSPRATRAVPSGENLWMGSRGLYDYEVMVGAFLNERRYFRRAAKMPNFSTTGRWQDVAHYTQIIWRGTRSVGCALAEGRSFDYLVCRYYPAGNMFGMGPLDAAPVLAGGEE